MATPGGTTEPGLLARLADGSLTGLWRLDAARSTVDFQSKSMWGLVTVKGVFKQVSGEGAVSESGAVSGTLTVQSGSVDTRNSKRDEHLRSADLLDSASHPAIVFTAQQVSPDGAGVTVRGSLQVRDNQRPITFPAVVSGSGNELRVQAEVPIDRSEFGVAWNQMGMASMKNVINVNAVFVRD